MRGSSARGKNPTLEGLEAAVNSVVDARDPDHPELSPVKYNFRRFVFQSKRIPNRSPRVNIA